jgi:hypothetical protein
MASHRVWILAAAILLGGCGGEAEEQTLCVVKRTPVPAGEVTSFGFSGDQVLALAEGTHMAQLTWNAFPLEPSVVASNITPGAATTVTVRIARAGGVYVVDQEPRMAYVPCPDGVQADIEVNMVSADGALAETGRGRLFSTSATSANLDFVIPRPPMGTLRIDAVPSSGLHFSSLSLDADFNQGPLWGSLILILVDSSGAADSSGVFIPAMLSPLTTTAAAPR